MKILLVEDDQYIGDFVSRGLKAKGHVVEVRDDGERGLEAARSIDWDAIILDINLPKLTGQEVCRLLRQDGSVTPIMMLTAMDSDDYIVESLRDGADDYMTKPFNFEQLLVRLEGFERRAKRFEEVTSSGVASFEDITFDKAALIVTLNGDVVQMTSLEYSLLGYLKSGKKPETDADLRQVASFNGAYHVQSKTCGGFRRADLVCRNCLRFHICRCTLPGPDP